MFETERFGYGVADEVVVRLGGVRVLDVRLGHPVPPRWLPSWTIGVVIGRVVRSGQRAYAVRFRHGDMTCVAVVEEGQVEGLA